MKTARTVEASDGVTFLTSLLLCFPALGSASLGPKLGEMRLEFYLDRGVNTLRFAEFVENFRMSWDLFFELVRACTSQRRIARVVDYPTEDPEHDSEVEIIRVSRDLETLTIEEISMIVSLIRERFLASIIEGERTLPSELSYQKQILRRSLDKVRADPSLCGFLTGFRDDMRVLVYTNEKGDVPSPASKERKVQ